MSIVLFGATSARAQRNDAGGSTPASIRASAARLAETVSASQDEGGVILRARSQGMAGLGVGLVGFGAMLAVARPSCGFEGNGATGGGFDSTYQYEATYVNGACDVAVEVHKAQQWFITTHLIDWERVGYYSSRGTHVEYVNEIKMRADDSRDNFFVLPFEVADIEPTTNNARRYVGLAVAGAGAFLIWYGLSRVEVPFRVDLTAGQGIGVRASRAFTW